MKTLLVVRPQPGANATLQRARALGLPAIAAPLFDVRPREWSPPAPDDFDAVLMTSAQAARHGGAGLAGFVHLPLLAVGAATAAAARAAGFDDVLVGEGDGIALLQLAADRDMKRLLHLAGRDHHDFDHPRLTIERRVVYAAEAVEALSATAEAALRKGAVVLLHSGRAAALFGTLVDAAGLDRAGIMVVALSPSICEAAGPCWETAEAAAMPRDDALLAIAARLCDQGGRRSAAGGG